MTQTEEGVYLFCFARAGAAREVRGETLAGSDGSEAVCALEAQGLVAIFRPVSLAEFQGELAEQRLQDPAWVVPRACQHERVVEAVMARSPVLPVRFGAVFSSRDALERWLAERHLEISGFLDFVADKEEWGAKAFVHLDNARERRLQSELALAERGGRLSESPGARYFQVKRLRAEVDQHVKLWSRRAAQEIQGELEADAVGFRALPLQVRNPSERPEDMVLNGALLVARARLADFRGRAEALGARFREQGLSVELSGPWPPYHFCPDLNGRH